MGTQDKFLSTAIQKKLEIATAVQSDPLKEVMRGLRQHVTSLIEGLEEKEMHQMALGLSHTLNRYKLKFSPDKVDTMVIQAVGLLDDLDKELNNYAMRLREWYGWHFPEMGKIVTDNMMYAKTVVLMGFKSKAKDTDFSVLGLPEGMDEEVKQAAETSMGTEITEEDLANIRTLCDTVVNLSAYRLELASYLKNRMHALAPNLTYMVGELVGARLVSQAGSLMNLAKHPSSTLQILGAEKALFRALKTKKNTPKYGLIYHASLVGQSAPNLKGKISRVLAAKLSLCARLDALGGDQEPVLGKELKEYVESRLASLEDTGMRSMTKGVSKPDAKKATKERNTADRPYNADADALVEEAPVKEKKRKAKDADEAVPAEGDKAERKRRKAAAAAAAAEGEEPDAVPEKKKKKRKTEAAEE